MIAEAGREAIVLKKLASLNKKIAEHDVLAARQARPVASVLATAQAALDRFARHVYEAEP